MNQLLIISKDDLAELIENSVKSALKNNPKNESEVFSDRLLTESELRNIVLPEKPARQTLYGWISNRKIPYEKHGRKLYFRKSTIEKWLANGRQMNEL